MWAKYISLHDGDETSVQIVCLRLPAVHDLDGEGSARNGEDGRLEEVLGELDSVQRGRGDDQFQLGSRLNTASFFSR